MRKSLFLATAFGVMAISPAHAGKPAPVKDPNKIVCKADTSTGSRLAQTKQCMTNAQWDEQKQLNRNEVEKIQSNRYKNQ